jgi:hypothetical protein
LPQSRGGHRDKAVPEKLKFSVTSVTPWLENEKSTKAGATRRSGKKRKKKRPELVGAQFLTEMIISEQEWIVKKKIELGHTQIRRG